MSGDDGLRDDGGATVLDRATVRARYRQALADQLGTVTTVVVLDALTDAVMTARDGELRMLRQRLRLVDGLHRMRDADELRGLRAGEPRMPAQGADGDPGSGQTGTPDAAPEGCLSGAWGTCARGCRYGCRWAADEVTRLGQEMDTGTNEGERDDDGRG